MPNTPPASDENGGLSSPQTGAVSFWPPVLMSTGPSRRGKPSTIHQQTETMTFNYCCFAIRPNDRIMAAHTRRPLMNQHASKKRVPPSVGADVSGIERLLNRNLPEVFGEGDPARRRAAI